MKILLAYGSALSRIDDMKLFGGISGGRTGREILMDAAETGAQICVLTNPWLVGPQEDLGVTKDAMVGNVTTKTFKTWEEYQDVLLDTCKEWKPDIVICAVAVSNYTPDWIVENVKPFHSWPPQLHHGQVDGKIDSRRTPTLTIQMSKTPNIIGNVRNLGNLLRDPVLVGFKLTSHGDKDQLVAHAQSVMEDASCDLVVANDLKLGLANKTLVTPVGQFDGTTKSIIWHAVRIWEAKASGFYRSVTRAAVEPKPKHKDIEKNNPGIDKAYETSRALWQHLETRITPHGCFAVRIPKGGFVTTTRGKEGMYTDVRHTGEGTGNGCLTVVWNVDCQERTVFVGRHQFSQEKATLNAPALDAMFSAHPRVKVIVHLHTYYTYGGAPILPYVPPGTDAEATLASNTTSNQPVVLNIRGHGSLVGFDHDDVDRIMAVVENPKYWTRAV